MNELQCTDTLTGQVTAELISQSLPLQTVTVVTDDEVYDICNRPRPYV